MSTVRLTITSLAILTLLYLMHPHHAHSQTSANLSASVTLRDGSHDFDFNFGTWHTHIRKLQHPLSGSRVRHGHSVARMVRRDRGFGNMPA